MSDSFWSGKRVLVGLSGGIAAYKTLDMIRRLRQAGAELRVVATTAALQFVTPLTVETLAGGPVHHDLFSLTHEREIGHIRLARESDVIILAPATADLLARMAQGRADDLLTTVLLAFQGPIVAAPAMNSAMWTHPATRRNQAQLIQDGVIFVGPESGALACGEQGEGRMAAPETIIERTRRALTPNRFQGARILITAGPTREALDPVRYLSNHSSGRMGWAVAEAALRMGARVALIHGPVAMPPPLDAEAVSVVSAREMRDAALSEWPACVAGVCTAAVADYRPVSVSEGKRSKALEGTDPVWAMTENPDILAELTRVRHPGQVVVGFAAETHPDPDACQAKLYRKGCDLLVVNDVLEPGSGFGTLTNRVTVHDRTGRVDPWPQMTKSQVGERLMTAVHARLQELSLSRS
jgi:phosphopantothenoylcysteine decarboxylase/phosphopantothenate--cysteine ligase